METYSIKKGLEMNLEQARVKLSSVSNSIGTKHPKVLVAELCVIVKFLLNEIDSIKTPTITLSSTKLPEPEVMVDPPLTLLPSKRSSPLPFKPFESPPSPPSEPYDPNLERKRRGNAGDAK